MANPDWIQGTSGLNGNIAVSTGSLTLAGVTAGSVLGAAILYNSTTDNYTSVSDNVNAGNYTKQIAQTAGNPTPTANTLYVAWMKNAGAGSTTITFSFSVAQIVWWGVFEVGPCDTSAPLDGSNKQSETVVGLNDKGAALTTTNAIDVVVAILLSNAGNFVAPEAGFTNRLNIGNPSGNLIVDTKAVIATGTYGGTAYNTGAGNDDDASAILAFKNPQAGAVKFRRTLSQFGSGVGKRQIHAWNRGLILPKREPLIAHRPLIKRAA